MKKTMVLTLSSALLLGACGDNEKQSSNQKTEQSTETGNQTNTSESNSKAQDKMFQQNKEYSERLKDYSNKLTTIAESIDNETKDIEEIVSQSSIDSLKKYSSQFDSAKTEFASETNNLEIQKDTELEKLLNAIAVTYSDSYKELAKNIEVGVNDAAYKEASELTVPFTIAALTAANTYLTESLDQYSKERLDAMIGEEEANRLAEMIYDDYETLDQADKNLADATIRLRTIEIPSDSADKLITPGFTFNLFKSSGMNDGTKDVTATEYNNNIENYNESVHPLLSIGTIDGPTTIDINNVMIGRHNMLIEAFMENDIDY